MTKVKRDSDPKNDYSDGRYSGIKYVAKRLGVPVKALLRLLRGQR